MDSNALKELEKTAVATRDLLLGASIAHNWATFKKDFGQNIAARWRTHKQYLRKHHLGKFAKKK